MKHMILNAIGCAATGCFFIGLMALGGAIDAGASTACPYIRGLSLMIGGGLISILAWRILENG